MAAGESGMCGLSCAGPIGASTQGHGEPCAGSRSGVARPSNSDRWAISFSGARRPALTSNTNWMTIRIFPKTNTRRSSALPAPGYISSIENPATCWVSTTSNGANAAHVDFKHGRASTIGVGGVDSDRAGRVLWKTRLAIRTPELTPVPATFSCANIDGRMGKQYAGKEGEILQWDF
jgi:hypothetical protein